MGDLLSAVVLAMVVATIVVWGRRLLRSPEVRADYLGTVRAMRWWMVPAALVQITVVATALWALTAVAPVTEFGWWSALGGSGNIALGQTGRDGAVWSATAVADPLLVFLLVPVFAHNEERFFREGSETWSLGRRIRTPIVFGLVHLTMGIPIAAGFALAVSGFYFQWVYLRAVHAHRPAIDTMRNTPRPEPAAVVDEPYPPLPIGAPYAPEEWDRVQAVRAEIRARNWQRRRDQEDRGGERVDHSRQRELAVLRRPAVETAAAAHAVSNWILCGVLVVFLVSDLVVG